MECYKVVSAFDVSGKRELYSAVAYDDSRLTYHADGTPTLAEYGGLLTFDCQENAFQFAEKNRNDCDLEVWRAEGTGEIPLPAERGSLPRWYREAWENKWNPSLLPHLLQWPAGTMAFEIVQLRERIARFPMRTFG